MIKGIIFDFGNVICSFDNNIFIDRLAKRCKYSGEEISRLLYLESPVVEDYETGKITSKEFFGKVKGMLDLSMDIETFRHAFTDIFTPIPEVIELIKRSKESCKLALLSNTNEWDHAFGIGKVEVYPLFDAVTLSYQVGVKKPDDRIFLDCLDKLGLKADECIFVDDIEKHVEKARTLGMYGIHCKDGKELEKKLDRYTGYLSKKNVKDPL
ncbi:MAG: HAD family phosphatase [Thermoplasmatota archaeon]